MRNSRGGSGKTERVVVIAVMAAAVMSFVGLAARATSAQCAVPTDSSSSGTVCTLEFQTQPADAKTGTTITSVPGNPNGARVQVKVTQVQGDGVGPVQGVEVTLVPDSHPGSISGNTATSDKNGLATFTDLKINTGGRYTLTATATGANDSAPSNKFTIYNDAKFCGASNTQRCTATASDDVTRYDVTVRPPHSDGSVFVSVGLDKVNCPGGAAAKSVATSASTFIHSSDESKYVTVSIDKSGLPPGFEEEGENHEHQGQETGQHPGPGDPTTKKVQICYQQDVNAAPGQPGEMFLPDCGVAPCVVSRSFSNGKAKVLIKLNLGDPKYGYCVTNALCV